MKTRFGLLLAGICAVLAFQTARADGVDEPIPSFYQEPGLSPNRDYVSQHPNEHIDPFTGKLQVHYVDLFIPGNGGLDLKIQRSYTSLNGSPGEESAYGLGWTMHFGRVLRKATNLICDFGAPVTHNPVLELPDGSRQILYVALDGMSFITTSRWAAVCAPNGSGLTVFSPDGTRYEMTTQGPSVAGSPTTVQNTYYVTRIVDRNGNTLSFTYDRVTGTTFGITTISASDGRLITFTYKNNPLEPSTDGALETITDGSRTWTYFYEPVPNRTGSQFHLKEVRRPDGASWKYDYHPFVDGDTPGEYSLKRVTYPTAGTIDYSYGFVLFNSNPYIPRSTVITQKVSSGSGEQGTWTYAYRPATQMASPDTPYPIDPSIENAQFDRTTVVGPEGTHMYFHIGYGSAASGTVYAIGLLMGTCHVGTQNDSYAWVGQLISNQANVRPGSTLVFDALTYAPIKSYGAVNRNGQGYATYYGYFDPEQPGSLILDYDEFGNPLTITETGTDTRVTSLTYHTDPSKWIIHLKKDETLGNVPGSIARTFDGNGNLLSLNRYGVATNYTYTPQGDLDSRTDARSKTTFYSDYFRGIARTENRPEAVTITRAVSADGNVTSQTDGEFATTTYQYDSLNRLTGINHPLGNPVSITWTPNSRTVVRGAYKEITTFDPFGRQSQVQHVDTARNETINQTYRYDALGRRVFASYPNAPIGTGYDYSIIGQIYTVKHAYDPIAGTAQSGRAFYYAYNTVALTNERSLVHTYTYRGYGSPEHLDLMAVASPEPNTEVAMQRNGLGQLTQVTQNGLVREYGYNSAYFLTSKTDPELGTTQFGRDEVGNLTSRQVGASALTQFAYDGLNRLSTITYPNGTPSVAKTYYRDDKIKSLDNGTARRDYVYNTNKSLTKETLTIGGQTFITQYGYDDNDALGSLTYASGTAVQYSPDAFGRPTQAVPYVTAVSHHPTGQVSGMTYANGVQSAVGFNLRNWPNQLTIGKGSNFVAMTYVYDPLANVTQISDSVDSSYLRTMSYDGIDRLKDITGPWAGNSIGTITYDGQGNVRSQLLGTASLAYTYDTTSNRLTGVSGWKTASYSYDPYGNVTGDGSMTFTYDDAPNMRCAKCGQPDQTLYDYDGANVRVRSQQSGATTYFVQGMHGNLLWEQTPGVGLKEYIYLGGKQVAVRQQAQTGQ